jgi:hypothetical protein
MDEERFKVFFEALKEYVKAEAREAVAEHDYGSMGTFYEEGRFEIAAREAFGVEVPEYLRSIHGSSART